MGGQGHIVSIGYRQLKVRACYQPLSCQRLIAERVTCGHADKGTGKKQDIKITGASTLGSDEVDRMVKDAEQYADEDKKQREAVDVKNQVSCSSVLIRDSLLSRCVPEHACYPVQELAECMLHRWVACMFC